ncbi:MAG: hypothetical protein JWO76_1677 [Nocardioides sp.]|nr:hypothetical protein [Nocardioides sp.]
MPFLRAPRAALVASTLAVGALAFGGCGDGSKPSATGPSTSGTPTGASETTIGSCDQAIPSAVVAGLGWDDATSATEGRGGCTWIGDQGSIWVYGGSRDLTDTCADLQKNAPFSTFEGSLENPAGLEACGYVRDGDLGASEIMVAEASSGRVMTINLVATEPTSPARVRTALLALAATTEDVP